MSVEFISICDVAIFELLRYCEFWRFIYIPLFVDTGNVSEMLTYGIKPTSGMDIHINAW